MKKVLNKLYKVLDKHDLLPTFTEDTIFLTLISLVVIYFIYPSSQKEIFNVIIYSEKAMLMVIIGFTLTLYTAFFTYFKTEAQKHYMIWFALIINLAVGITALISMNKQATLFVWYIFPILNIAIFFCIAIFWHAGVYHTGRLTTRSINYDNIAYGSMAVLIIALVYKLIPSIGWQTVFSTSVAYATIFNMTLVQHLPKLFHKRGNQLSLMQMLIDKSVSRALQEINTNGLDPMQILVTTRTTDEIYEVDEKYSDDISGYINNFVHTNYGNQNIAVVTTGTYQWKQSWWSKVQYYDSLIIDLYWKDKRKKYEFCQIMDYGEEFMLGERGLVYLKSIPTGFNAFSNAKV
jgi:hypothetical protein